MHSPAGSNCVVCLRSEVLCQCSAMADIEEVVDYQVTIRRICGIPSIGCPLACEQLATCRNNRDGTRVRGGMGGAEWVGLEWSVAEHRERMMREYIHEVV